MICLRPEQLPPLLEVRRHEFFAAVMEHLRCDPDHATFRESELEAMVRSALALSAEHGIEGRARVLRLLALVRHGLAEPWAQRVLAWKCGGPRKLAALEFYACRSVLAQSMRRARSSSGERRNGRELARPGCPRATGRSP